LRKGRVVARIRHADKSLRRREQAQTREQTIETTLALPLPSIAEGALCGVIEEAVCVHAGFPIGCKDGREDQFSIGGKLRDGGRWGGGNPARRDRRSQTFQHVEGRVTRV
jgi:hypothetical protein